MRPANNINELIKKLHLKASSELDKRVHDDITKALAETQKTKSAQPAPNIWRIIMKSKITKLAAAAVIITAVLLSINVWDNSMPAAYAFEQTIQASHSVRYIHTKSFWASHKEPTESWIEFDVTGKVRNVRLHLPAWTEPDDGDKKIVWKDNKAYLWIKKKNIYAVMKDNIIAEMIFTMIEGLDPKTALQSLQMLKSEDKAELDIEQPKDKTSPIIVTAILKEEAKEEQPTTEVEREMKKLFNLFKGSEKDISKFVLFIDQATKLITTIEFYEQRQGRQQCICTIEYYDYNQPIAAEIFVLEDEISADALRIDQTTQDVGIAQGDLTNKEVAVELVRQFLEALIAKDYAKAGRLFSGTPAERMEKTYGKIRFIRIISIGEPEEPNTILKMPGAFYVPCTIEIEENGKIIQWHPEHSYVRQVHGQPGRWEIIGGFRGI